MCSLGIEPTTFALLTQCSNHWATGTHFFPYMEVNGTPKQTLFKIALWPAEHRNPYMFETTWVNNSIFIFRWTIPLDLKEYTNTRILWNKAKHTNSCWHLYIIDKIQCRKLYSYSFIEKRHLVIVVFIAVQISHCFPYLAFKDFATFNSQKIW